MQFLQFTLMVIMNHLILGVVKASVNALGDTKNTLGQK